MRHHSVSMVMVGCLLGACAACGSSAPSGGGATATAQVVNPVADRATASAINLAARDLPGWTQSAASSDAVDPSDVQTAACAGASNPQTTQDVNVNSPNFDQGNTEVSSSVDFVRTRAEALQDLGAFTGTKLASCLREQASSELSSQLPNGTTVGNITVTPVEMSSLPPHAFALRFTVDITAPQQAAVPVAVDEIGFLAGRAEVALTVTQASGTPGASSEQYLLSVLVTRTQQQGNRTT